MLLSVLMTTSVLADEDWRELHDAVQRGELVELPTILDWLQSRYRGEVLEVELERDDGATLYEIEMLGPQGQVVEFEFDASDGQLIGMEGANINAMRKSP
ncbi:PepSY domain-containing protein [Halomonas halmophila]|uniref:Peptidase n=1 Tax=Halomonas halmophila TaxID=252 RepID=A0A4Y4F327_9GAMM|nr:PepSY domain-containing protein [Halomonas halmophila]GED21541.1 peptidase [Halomonas halmophila]